MNLEKFQEEYICTEGLFSGYFLSNNLGPSKQGVSLNVHPDCCTPADFFDGVKFRIAIFKILKGRSKIVQLGGETRADSNFNSHIAASRPDLQNEPSPQIRFCQSQVRIFLFLEFGKNGMFLDLSLRV